MYINLNECETDVGAVEFCGLHSTHMLDCSKRRGEMECVYVYYCQHGVIRGPEKRMERRRELNKAS